jgi:hypothetical protein
MAKNDTTNSENILVKVNQNNLVYIDPNSVVSDGIIEPRSTSHENLVYYINLEADLVPRTTLNSANGGGGKLTSVAKGTLNLLQNKDGDYLDTKWTDVYTEQPTKDPEKEGIYEPNHDASGQSFGMTSVSIEVKGVNFVPVVNVSFVDIRGKTLFESPDNSPYKSFFHLPWPIFYLTVKGYYGKAIRYRLHLINFNTSYNAGNGNFESTAKFVGSTYAYLNDISLTSILNAPYMYGIEIPTKKETNTKTGESKVKLSKTSRGYQTLLSVYQEYRRKGLITIPEGVNPTLRELIQQSKSLDQALEESIFGDNGIVDMKLFGLVKEFDDALVEFVGAVKAWRTRYLAENYTIIPPSDGIKYNYLSKDQNNKTTNIVGPKSGTLESILKVKSAKIKKIQNSIRELLKKSGKEFKSFNVSVKNPLSDINTYYLAAEPKLGGKIGVAYELIIDHINEIITSFNQEKKKLQDKVEEKMNEIVKSNGNEGLGFEPTIRNVFGVVLASADTYLRLMQNVHYRAYNVREEKKNVLVGFSDESTSEGAVYPWPEVNKVSEDKKKILAYPAEFDLVKKLRSDNPTLWPEVEFVEEYMAVSQRITDNLSEKEKTFDKVSFEFENSDPNQNDLKKISEVISLGSTTPYSDKTLASLFYEIAERGRYSVLNDTFDSEKTIKELADLEFQTLQSMVEGDSFVVDILKEISTLNQLQSKMESFSPFERKPYYNDGIATVPYISDNVSESFKLQDYSPDTLESADMSEEYEKLKLNLVEYNTDSTKIGSNTIEYRTNIYPFNSTTYLGYIDKTSITKNDINLKGIFDVKTTKGLIQTPINSEAWVRDDLNDQGNIFNIKSYLDIGGDNTNLSSVINTPYFHRALFEDFHNTNSSGKYKSSAYLLLNSLPYHDLDMEIELVEGKKTRMSNIFKEISSTHFIPYHLMVKWGSIYHRYKTYILDGVDILNGVELPINGSEYFDNNQNITYSGITKSDQTDIGIHPYYSGIFHQVINGYLHFNVNDTTTTSFNNAITNEIMYIHPFTIGNKEYYNSFVDNSKFVGGEKRYTILPSHGTLPRLGGDLNNLYNPYSTDYNITEQYNFNVDWCAPHGEEFAFSGVTFPPYNQYISKDNNNQNRTISGNNKKVIDLIATFSPEILNEFEDAFIKFSSEKVDTFQVNKQFETVQYDKFQNLLHDLVTVEKKDEDDLTNINNQLATITNRQVEQQKYVTQVIVDSKNLVQLTLANPKELNLNAIKLYTVTGDRTYDRGYESSQLTNNSKYIELYLGEDMDGYYSEFFPISDMILNEDNVLHYRSIIQIYAGYRANGGNADKTEFSEYLNNVIVLPFEKRFTSFMTGLLSQFPQLKRSKDRNNNLGVLRTFGMDPLKLETYSMFKLFNDRWSSGNSIGQRLLMEEFLFLDKANKDIGDDLFYDVKRLQVFELAESQNLKLYNVISQMLSRNNLDFRPLPAYVNFYGNRSGKTKVKKSEEVASLLFGKFLDVDVEHSTPKMIVQYVGKPSSHIDTSTISKDYKYKNDTFNVGDVNNNPVLITDPNYFEQENFKNSNKVVAFEVSFGDQNQGIFKSISLDQSQFKETFESNVALENTARSESGSGVAQVSTNLYDIYKVRSYECTVECMGNVMIQPTMYFQLKNVPLFAGAYWIVEVSHRIENNTIRTNFKGVRMPSASLPDPKESFTASYRVMYDKIMKSALAKIKSETKNDTSEIISTSEGNFKTDRGGTIIEGEELLKESGVTNLGVPFNGYKNIQSIQKVKYQNKTWFRTIVTKFDGPTNLNMSLPTQVSSGITVKPSKVPFTEIDQSSNNFYRLNFYSPQLTKKNNTTPSQVSDYLLTASSTDFKNPKNGITKTIVSSSVLDSSGGATRQITGPADEGGSILTIGDKKTYSGMALSKQLMKDLKLQEGDVIYFNIR